MGAKIPVPDLTEAGADEPEKVHAAETDDPSVYGDDYWRMACGLEVRAFDDGTLVPPVDFYPRRMARKATCEACRRACGEPPLRED